MVSLPLLYHLDSGQVVTAPLLNFLPNPFIVLGNRKRAFPAKNIKKLHLIKKKFHKMNKQGLPEYFKIRRNPRRNDIIKYHTHFFSNVKQLLYFCFSALQRKIKIPTAPEGLRLPSATNFCLAYVLNAKNALQICSYGQDSFCSNTSHQILLPKLWLSAGTPDSKVTELNSIKLPFTNSHEN